MKGKIFKGFQEFQNISPTIYLLLLLTRANLSKRVSRILNIIYHVLLYTTAIPQNISIYLYPLLILHSFQNSLGDNEVSDVIK